MKLPNFKTLIVLLRTRDLFSPIRIHSRVDGIRENIWQNKLFMLWTELLVRFENSSGIFNTFSSAKNPLRSDTNQNYDSVRYFR